VVSVSGSSIGALVGGVYALGKLDEYADWVRAIRSSDIFKLLDLTFDRDGFVRGDRIIEALRELVGDARIEDLDIPFTAVASNIDEEREVWLNSGPLFDAIRASMSLPLFFKPAEISGQRLLDGGILNPVPIAPTFNDEADITIAVNLGGKPDPEFEMPSRAIDAADADSGDKTSGADADIGTRIAEFINSLDVTQKLTDHYSRKFEGSMLDIADRMFDTMQGAIARQQMAVYPPDVELVVPHNVCGMLEFDRADELITMGYELAGRRLGRLVGKNT
jgi:NTE family protein